MVHLYSVEKRTKHVGYLRYKGLAQNVIYDVIVCVPCIEIGRILPLCPLEFQ